MKLSKISSLSLFQKESQPPAINYSSTCFRIRSACKWIRLSLTLGPKVRAVAYLARQGQLCVMSHSTPSLIVCLLSLNQTEANRKRRRQTHQSKLLLLPLLPKQTRKSNFTAPTNLSPCIVCLLCALSLPLLLNHLGDNPMGSTLSLAPGQTLGAKRGRFSPSRTINAVRRPNEMAPL